MSEASVPLRGPVARATRYSALAMAVLLLAGGMGGSLAAWRRDRLLATAAERRLSELRSRASQAAELLDRWFDERTLAAFETAELVRGLHDRAAPESAVLPLARGHLLRHENSGAWLVDSTGAVLDSAFAGEPLDTVVRRTAAEAVRRRSQALVGPLILPSGAARLYFVVPGLRGGRYLVLALDPGLSLFGAITVTGASVGSTQRLRLLRRAGNLAQVASPASHPPSEPLGLELDTAAIPATWRAALTLRQETAIVTSRAGIRTLSAGHALRAPNLGIVLEVDAEEALLPARQRFRSEAVMSVSALLIGLTLAGAAWRDGVRRRRAAERLAREGRRREAILDAAGDGILGVSVDGVVEFANRAAHAMLGTPTAGLVGRSLEELLTVRAPGEGAESVMPDVQEVVHGNRDELRHARVLMRRSGASDFPAELVATRRHEDDGSGGAVIAFRDVTKRLAAEEARRVSEMRLQAIFDNAALGIAVLDAQGRILDTNLALCLALGAREASLEGRHISTLVSGAESPAVADALERVRDGLRSTASLVVGVARPGDGAIDCRLSLSRLDPALPARGFVALVEDVTERKSLERQLLHQAFHDPLTGLANRALFFEYLAGALAREGRTPGAVAAFFIDIDDFKLVNDQWGHHAGDEVLREVATRLRAAMRTGDQIARLAGDEFAIMIDRIDGPGEVALVSERVLATLSTPFSVEGRVVSITASIGVAQSLAGDDVSDLLRRADMAMYAAKRRGKGAFEIFDAAIHGATFERLQIESDLRHAVEREELFLQYQPIVDLETQRVEGVEALVRWRHPERGLIPPGSFIMLAESGGEIVRIGRWVLREALRQLAAWDRAPHGGPSYVSVNVSIHQLQHDALVHEVEQALADFALAPHRLQLEVTESALAADSAAVAQRLRALAERGTRIAIDDFGTGYSSLAYLQRFPLHVLKIDKTFIDGIGLGGTAGALARTIIALGDTLGLATIAEGVEHDRQRLSLLGLGCSRGQGFLFARPLDAAAVAGLLSRGAVGGELEAVR